VDASVLEIFMPLHRSIRCFAVVVFLMIGSWGLTESPDLEKSPDVSSTVAHVQFKAPGAPVVTIEGKLIAEGTDGGCLLVEPEGRLRVIVAREMEKLEKTEQAFRPMNQTEMGEHLLKQLPKGFAIVTSKNYVIAYNTTEAYAKWNASLYERLFKAFYVYWKRLGSDLESPEFPLVTIIFDTQAAYLKYARKDGVANAENMIGYYNLLTNRIATYDLTGIEGMIPPGKRVYTSDLVNAILSQPSAERSVATIVHEAVHQLAYNSQLQRRLADNPLSISEGLAMFFEAPDLKNPSGWGGIGKVSGHNLAIFRHALASNQGISLSHLIQEDSAFHDPKTVSVAYGESWALSYFLMKTKGKELAAYLKEMNTRPPLEPSDSKRRLSDFERFFGGDIEKIEKDFVKYMSRVQ
jgi:hypothetical protein